jgi:hypothetical protein
MLLKNVWVYCAIRFYHTKPLLVQFYLNMEQTELTEQTEFLTPQSQRGGYMTARGATPGEEDNFSPSPERAG